MVLAYHSIFCAYGFWLPNDPRGSWSDFVRAWELLRFGPATKTESRRSVAGRPHSTALRAVAIRALKHKPVVFDGHQALSIAHGFEELVGVAGYAVYACSIMPEHVHMVIGRHRYPVEQIVGRLKGRASKRLADDGRHPFAEQRRVKGKLPSPWAQKGWNVFLDSAADIRRAIQYVEANPGNEGKRAQSWPFAIPYEG